MKGPRLAHCAVAALALTAAAAGPASAQLAVTETVDPSQQQDADFARAYLEWTSESPVRQPTRGSPSDRAGHPDAQGRSRLLDRAAEDAHLLRGHPHVLPSARARVASRYDRDDRGARTKGVSWSSSGSPRKRTSRDSPTTGTSSPASPIRAGARTPRSASSSRRPSRTTT